jgi:lipopolysaccharide transport system permease protein
MLGFGRRDVITAWNFFKMNLRDRYLASRFGMAWALINPLLMLSIFTFVFGFIFKTRLPGAETTLAYAIWLISGYGPWLAVSESLTSASNSVVSASGLIKNLAFKSETLPIVAALLGFVPLAVSMLFLLVLLVVDGNIPTWHVIFVPFIMLLQFLLVIAMGFFLAATNVFVRDLGLLLPNILTMVLFLSPIFYPLESMPRAFQIVSAYNPFYLLAEAYRAVLLHHRVPSLPDVLYLSALAASIGYFALAFFRRAKGSFDAAL